jgi:hypothetical protein
MAGPAALDGGPPTAVADSDAALKIAREARDLPTDVFLFYLRVLRSAARRGELTSLHETERPSALCSVIERAGGSKQVVTVGGHSALSAIALAIDDESRSITVVHPLAGQWERDDCMQFVDAHARARIDFCSEVVTPLPEGLRGPDLVLDVDALLRPDDDGVGPPASSPKDVERLAAADENQLPAAIVGLPKRGAGRIVLAGALAGLAAAVLLPASLSESLPWTSGNGNDLAPPKPRVETARAQPTAAGVAGAGDRETRGTSRAAARGTPAHLPLRQSKPGAGTFSGAGDRSLGTLRVDRPTTLRWTARESLQIVSQDWRFRARPPGGTTVLTPGTYRRFAVKSSRRWKLRLDPLH